MARRARQRTPDESLTEIDRRVHALKLELSGLGLREKVLRLVLLNREVRVLGVAVVREDGINATNARDRIRQYLEKFVGVVVAGDELQVVSGISEYARRVRELRVEQGFSIATGMSPDSDSGIDLRPDEYMLTRLEPDTDAARRWHIVNRIRRLRGSSVSDRILAFLRENVGVPVTTEELAYVARNRKEFGRRTRELRTQQGYAVATRFTGRPDLANGQYVLESLERRAPPHDRAVEADVARRVYERDRNSCRACGWSRDRWTRADPRFLELHHVEGHAEGGLNTEANLVVLCSRCHDSVHAETLIAVERGGQLRFEQVQR